MNPIFQARRYCVYVGKSKITDRLVATLVGPCSMGKIIPITSYTCISDAIYRATELSERSFYQ